MTMEREKTALEQEVSRKLREALLSVEKYFAETPVRFDAEYETVYENGVYKISLVGESAKSIRARHRKARWHQMLARLTRRHAGRQEKR